MGNGRHDDRAAAAAEAFKAFEAAGWGARVETYERLTGRLTAGVIEPLLDAAAIGSGRRVLDVGTGTGAIAAAAAARGASPVGIDLAEEMVAGARGRHPGVEFRRGDAEQLPFGSGEFDAVVAGFVFNHLPLPESAAAECARVLGAGGRLAVSVWDEPSNAPFFGVIEHAIREAGIDVAGALPAGPDPYRFAEDDELERLFARAGFGTVEVRTLEVSVRVADADELLTGVLGGTVRAGTILRRVSRDELAGVAAALRRVAAAYANDGGLELPARVKLASGVKAPVGSLGV
jgi:ubiquinone/menaquinone biosynthesis C-methylase UbiE